ncbi:MAG: DUF493 family protein [Flavobacteriaceae bacterium]|nr:DUF493 family protein [Flavobacteriaceae bacterium]
MSENNSFDSLREKLEESNKYPCRYMFKYVMPADGEQEGQLKEIFKDLKTTTTVGKSKTGKYKSITIVMTVENTDQIIDKYLKVENIKGLVSL